MITYNENQYFKYSELSAPEKPLYYELVFRFVRRLSWEYPDFLQWYEKLFTDEKELHSEREIIVCEKHFTIVGLAILKSDIFEKKICTLRVDKKFQRQGIGTRLMEMSLEWLEDDHPVITMHKMKQNQFAPLLQYYGFQLEQTQPHYYSIFGTEYVYNGTLPEKDFFFNKFELMDMQKLCQQFMKTGRYNFNEFVDECLTVWYKRELRRKNIMKF